MDTGAPVFGGRRRMSGYRRWPMNLHSRGRGAGPYSATARRFSLRSIILP